MAITYILVDLENVQPRAGDLSLLRGESFRVLIFHGVHQNKFDVNMYKALQPLGDKVELIQSDRVGADVLDFHISFYLGRRLQEHLADEATGAGRSARFFVISKDKGFDSLLVHVRSLGFEAHRVASIQAVLDTPPHGAGAARKTAVKKAPVRKPAERKAAVAKGAAAKAQPTRTAAAKPAAKAAIAKPAAARPVPRKPAAKKAAADPRAIVLESLRRMGEKKRPGKRKGLEHHIESHLGRKVDLDAVRALIESLERDGELSIVDNKVDYRLSKPRR